MNTINVLFTADGFRLNGTLHMPKREIDNGAMPIVVGSHGLLSNGGSPKQIALAEKLNRAGIAYFRFDHRGRGESDGLFSEVSTFAGRINDMSAAIEAARTHSGADGPLGLFGSSMGGAVCLGVADRFNIRAMVTLAAPVRLEAIRIPQDIANDPLFGDMKQEQLAFDVAPLLEHACGILVFHGDADEVVSFSNAMEIHEKTSPPKQLIRFSGGDHAISAPRYQQQFIEQAADWFISRLLSS